MKKADRIAMMIRNTGASVTEYRKGRESNFFVTRCGNLWGLEKSTSGCTCGVFYADMREAVEAYIEANGYKAVKTWTRDTETEPAAVQEATNEPEADATEAPDEYAEARKLHDDFARYVKKLELQASKAVSRAYVAKNPRLASALEKAKAKQAEQDATEAARRKVITEAKTACEVMSWGSTDLPYDIAVKILEVYAAYKEERI